MPPSSLVSTTAQLTEAAGAAPICDSPATLAALGLLAYLTADVAHHALGHGGACWATGGQVLRLTSIRTTCSCTGAAIDLGGPVANLLLGATALAMGRLVRPTAVAARLFLLLTAGFNLFFFAGQLFYCALTNSDDWWWPLRQAQASAAARYALAAGGLGLYNLFARLLARQAAPFAAPRGRATNLIGVTWLAAGVIACGTAAFDHSAATAILAHAVPQALLLPAGLWLLPARAAHWARATHPALPLAFSWYWVAGAAAAGAGSVLLLGPDLPFQ